jgi:hypothetical protein
MSINGGGEVSKMAVSHGSFNVIEKGASSVYESIAAVKFIG